MSQPELYVGLISGTSADGIDAALVAFEPALRLIAGRTFPYPDDVREQVLAISQHADRTSLDALGQLDARVGEAFADAANRLIDESDVPRERVRAIGSHGQTLRHRPDIAAAFTLQIADAARIVERTGITTIADFRRRDVAAGGHGAPLMPAFHAAMLHSAAEDRAVLNLGGIANLTVLPVDGPVRGFDTGPGNGLMDAWMERHRGERFDAAGAFGAQGRVDDELLETLCREPWLALPPPKSTGRDQFHLQWLDAHGRAGELPPENVQATLCQFTARTVVEALLATQPATRRLLVCGGGVHNPVLMARLAARLPQCAVESTAACGLDPDFVEAMGFAWLARETLAGRPGSRPDVTGARGPRILGAIHPA